MQTTIRNQVSFNGVGLHSGQPVRLTIRPASAGHGIWFTRTDIVDRDPLIPARWDVAEHSPLCTKLVNTDGVCLSTVEHVMAALAGCGRAETAGDDGPAALRRRETAAGLAGTVGLEGCGRADA